MFVLRHRHRVADDEHPGRAFDVLMALIRTVSGRGADPRPRLPTGIRVTAMIRMLDLAARREAKPSDPHDETAITSEDRDPATQRLHRIVVVVGGAAGLELATRLGDRLGRRSRAQITLVDCARTHLWKRLLHEVAAGSLDPGGIVNLAESR